MDTNRATKKSDKNRKCQNCIKNNNSVYLSVNDSTSKKSDTQISDIDSHCINFDVKSHDDRIKNIYDEHKDEFEDFIEISLCFLGKKSKIRLFCLRAITSPWFERITMLAILINCITLGMYKPCEDNNTCTSTRCVILQHLDNLIFIYFVIEMIIKIIAMGFIGKTTYLADSWNRLDFFIVLAGTLEFFLMSENLSLSAIRTIRVLRPLRAINRVPSMRILVQLLFDTLPMLSNVLLLCFFVFFVFGIMGLQLWKGVLRNRCHLDANDTNYKLLLQHIPKYYKPNYKDSFICTKSGGESKCSDIPAYVNHNQICNGGLELLGKETNNSCINWNQFYTVCDVSENNPFKDAISFDNIGYAWITIFQIISLESWVTIMYYLQDSHSFWNWIYFVVLIVIGSFFMINLCLVVIATQFSETKKRETERMNTERKRFAKSSSTLFSDTDPGTCYEELIKYIEHICRKLKRKITRYYKDLMSRREQKRRVEQSNNATHRNYNHINNNTNSYHFQVPDQTSFTFESQTLTLSPNRIRIDDDSKSKLSFLLMVPKAIPELSDITGLSINERKSSSRSLEPEIINTSVSNTSLYHYPMDCDNNIFESPKNLSLLESKRNSNASHISIIRQSSFKSVSENRKHKTVKIQESEEVKHDEFILSFYFSRLRDVCKRLVNTKLFARGILFAILINTLSMGVEHHNQPEILTLIVEIINYIFIVVFLIEMIAKIFACGFLEYLRSLFNVFDGLIVLLSLYELFRSFGSNTNHIETSDLSVLRTFRLLRIIKLVRFMPALRRQLVVMLKTIDNVATFCSLLALFIFIFSILGMNLFGCKFCAVDDGIRRCERKNFDSLLWSTITVFQILTQEDWNEVMYNGMEKLSASASLYFILLMTFGNYVLFNLLVAILVEGFSNNDLSGEKAKKPKSPENDDPFKTLILDNEVEMPIRRLVVPRISITEYESNNHQLKSKSDVHLMQQKRRGSSLFRQLSLDSARKRLERKKKRNNTIIRQSSLRIYKTEKSIEIDTTEEIIPSRNKSRRSSLQKFTEMITGKKINEEISCLVESCENNTSQTVNNSIEVQREKGKFQKFFEARMDYSLFLLSRENKFRRAFIYITKRKWFDHMILIIIALNCITLAMERPSIPSNCTERKILTISNYVFTSIFTIEMLFKVIAQGFFFGNDSYLSSGWNRVDGFLVFFSIFDIIVSVLFKASPKIFGVLRVFRLLRTLRPLRVISRAPGLKLVVETLFSSLRPIGNIVIICCTFFIIFGILGVQLFKGKFYRCEGENVLSENITNREDCLRNPQNKWVNPQYNFDNLGSALMALFVLASKDGWVQIMYMGIDAVGVDKQPIENYNEWMLLYFISFLLLVGFFVLNMFVGVVVENFHKCREAQEREEKARKAAKRAKRYEEKRTKMKEVPYFAKYSRFRRFIHDICINKYFDLIIAAVIGLNVVTMSLEFYMMPEVLEDILDYFNIIFTIIFFLEAIVKIISLGLILYLKDRWNQLDVLIVILSIMGIIFDRLSSHKSIPLNPTIIRVMRVLRIARVLKLLKMANGIRALLDTVIQALPQVGNLGLLFFLLFFIFATLGVELFGKLDCHELTVACDGISKHANFQNFGISFLTLFRIATGDNWNGIMKDALRSNVLCNDETGSSNICLASILAPVYFVIFVLMAQFVLVNVVIAVLMKHLDESNKMLLTDENTSEDDIDRQIEAEARNNIYKGSAQEYYDELLDNGFYRLTKQSSLPPNFTFDFKLSEDSILKNEIKNQEFLVVFNGKETTSRLKINHSLF